MLQGSARRQLLLAAGLFLATAGVVLAQAETVYVTKTGAKYHRASCSSLRKSKIEMALAEAAKRYGPCGTCRPPVVATRSSAVPAVRSALVPASPNAAVSASTRVLVTRTGKKYHREGCRTLRGGGIASTLGEASKRFGACAVCKPPELNAK